MVNREPRGRGGACAVVYTREDKGRCVVTLEAGARDKEDCELFLWMWREWTKDGGNVFWFCSQSRYQPRIGHDYE